MKVFLLEFFVTVHRIKNRHIQILKLIDVLFAVALLYDEMVLPMIIDPSLPIVSQKFLFG
jgi:hypothetical protein